MLASGLGSWAQEDITAEYLTNADLTSLSGWSYGDNGYTYTDWQTNGDVPVIEFYHTWGSNAGAAIGNTKNFHFTQTVTLPAGDYRIAVNAFYREGNGNGTNTKAYIFAGEKQQYIVGLSSAGVAAYTGSSDLYKAANAFSKGDFSNEFDFTVTEESEVELGFRGYIDTYCSWCILGPVKLYKYSLEDYLVDYRAKVAEANNLLSGKPMYSEVRDALNNAIIDENEFQLSSEVTAAIQTLVVAIDNAKASIAFYEKLFAVLENGMIFLNEAVENGAPTSCGTALDEIYSDYEDGLIANEDIAAKIAEVDAILIDVTRQQTKAGSDMTLLLVNPDFERNAQEAEGWTVDVPDYGNGNAIVGGNAFNRCFEAYNNPGFDVYQTVENVPFGVYEIEVQGFYRYLRGDNAWNAYQAQEVDYVKAAGVPVYVYMNDNATPFTNIFAETPVPNGELYTTDETLLNPGNTPPYVEPNGEYWYPNEMYNSALAFSEGMYKQSAYGLVAFEGDALRLGVKGVSNQGGDSWVIWDNFKLTYRGFAPEVIKPVLEVAVEDLETNYEGLLMGKSEYAALTAALADAEAAIANNDGEAMFNALKALYAAKDPARESKDVFLAQEVASDTLRLAEAIRNVENEKLSKATVEEAGALLNTIAANTLYENDMIDQLKADVTAMIDKLQNSIQLYTTLSEKLTALTGAIEEAALIEVQLTSANELYSDTYAGWEAGTIADEEISDRIGAIDDMIASLAEAVNLYNAIAAYNALVEEAQALPAKPMYNGVRDALNAAIVDTSTFTQTEQAEAASATLADAISNARASMALYEKLSAVLEKGMTFLNEAIENGAPTSCETALDDIYSDYEDGLIADDDIAAKIAEADAILIDVTRQQTKAGSDMTLLLVNPDFERDAQEAEGWTVDVPDYGSGNAIVGGNAFNRCFEAYNNPGFDVYQTVENVPFGVYEIEVQGFYRYLRGDNAWNAYQAQEVDYVKAAGVPVYVYMNDNATPFTNIFAETPVPNGELYTTDETLLNPGNTPPYVEPNGEYWYPNEMYNSALAFSEGMYKQSAYGLVAFEGDALRLGVKGVSNQGGDSWVIWDNFKLTYRGFAPEVIKPVLEVAVEDLETNYEGLLMGKSEYAALTAALADAEAAIANNDGEAMFNALKALYAAKDPARESKDVFLAKEVNNDTLRLAQAIREVETQYLSKTTLDAASALLKGLEENTIYETAEVEQIAPDVTAMIDRLSESVSNYESISWNLDELNTTIETAQAYNTVEASLVTEAQTLYTTTLANYQAGTIEDENVASTIFSIQDMIDRLRSSIEIATGIEGAKATDNTVVRYNMKGQKVQATKKGLYIENGKKVVKKK